MQNILFNYFHRLEVGARFQLHLGGDVLVKISKIGAHFDGLAHDPNSYRRINSQKLVIVVPNEEN